MKIEKLLLNGYVYLQFSDIDKLSIQTKKNIQVIIGDNGSGKSKVMNMLAPIVPLSTMFTKSGSMELHIEHLDHHYILGYDATTKIHSFQQDSIELNDSGTSMVSEELIETHLGYTKLIDKLIFNKMKMTQMASSARMEFLTSINPINIKFLKDKYVKVVSQLKKIKAQLELLHKRSSEYKSAMMDEIEFDKYQKDQISLKNIDNEVVQLIYRYSTLSSTLEDISPKRTLEEYRTVLRNLTHYRTQSAHKTWTIDYKSLEDLENQKSTISFKLHEYLLQLENLSKEIDDLEKVLSTSDTVSLTTLESQLEKYQNSLKTYPDFTDTLIIEWPPKSTDSDAYRHLHLLTELTQHISSIYSTKIWNIKKYQFHKERYTRILKLRDSTSIELQECQYQCSTIEKDAYKATLIKPDDTCTSTVCPLKCKYQEILQTEQNKVSSCKKHIEDLQKSLKKYNHILTVYIVLFEYQDIFHRHTGLLHQLYSTIQSISSSLVSLFPKNIDSIIEHLNTDTHSVDRLVKSTLQCSYDYWEMMHIKMEIKTLEAQIASKKKDISIQYAKTKVQENYKKLEVLDKEIKSLQSYLTTIDLCIAHEKKCVLAIQKTQSIVEDIQRDVVAYETMSKKHVYDSTKSQLEELHSHLSNFIRDNETIIAEQLRIRQLYNIEYKSVQSLEESLSELTILEKVLNPYTGLPSIYTKRYINKILEHVNYFISKVFTYKLYISLVEDTKNMKYKFNVLVDDVLAGDISNCSDGQMEIIDLSFTLALMIALGLYKTHPIYLDEIGRCLDSSHTQRLLEMLSELVSQRYIYQLFIINHQAVLAEGFDNADVICLRSENILLPENYNQHVSIN